MDSTANEEQRMLLDYTQRFINDVHPLDRVRNKPFADPDSVYFGGSSFSGRFSSNEKGWPFSSDEKGILVVESNGT